MTQEITSTASEQASFCVPKASFCVPKGNQQERPSVSLQLENLALALGVAG